MPRAGSWLVEVRHGEHSADRLPLRVLADPTGAPASSSGASCALVFEGRLYNRTELAALAGLEGLADNDADLLRRAYEQLGEALVRRLKGIFALILWDGRSRTLLAVRDPLGVIPLFYASSDGTLLLSTSIETLLHEPRVSSSPNRLALAGHLLELWPQSGETVLEFVRRVPPGHLVRWRGREHELSRYWDPAETSEEFPGEDEELLAQFQVLLTQAVDRGLESGPAAIFLSGGVDSGTIAAVACERSRVGGLPVPWALSLVFPHPSVNEESMQRRIAAGLGLPQVLLPFERAVGASGFLIASLESAARSPAPPVNLWRPAYDALIGEAARRGCALILTGEGGDEWLVPPSAYAADRLAALDLVALYRVWRAWHGYVPFPAVRTLRDVIWGWAARPLLRQAAGVILHAWSPSATRAHRLRRVSKTLPPWLAPDRDLRCALVELAVEGLAEPAPSSLYEQSKRRLAGHAGLGLLMEEWFEDGRSRGVHIREPFLDPDLVEFFYHVPPRVLICRGQTKWLARATLEGRLPALAAAWPKMVYADPFWHSLMMREGPGAWRKLGGVPALAELGVVDPDRFASTVESAVSSGSFPTTRRVWGVWTAEAWLRAHSSVTIGDGDDQRGG